jgi:hypothetical protein
MLLGIVAKNSILLDRLRDRGNGAGRVEVRSDHRGRAQARPADRHDHRGDDRGHDADRAVAVGDGAWRAPMGTVVIGGLMLSTLLTLLIVPAAFSLADGWKSGSARSCAASSLLTFEPTSTPRPRTSEPSARKTGRRRNPGRVASRCAGASAASAISRRTPPDQGAAHAPDRHRPAGGHGGGLPACAPLRRHASGVGLSRSPSPRRRWSAGWPTGSR